MAQVKIMTDDGSAFRLAVQYRNDAGEWVHCEYRHEAGVSAELPLQRYRYIVESEIGSAPDVS
ncbi:hypothetical protein [Bradyrhizobium sp. G127]|uniref:hypothetical protein n=1 Tax=Bradyrhizobium sp. G127 TaxID=2904800 RepID=UPI001F476052|nr:hypothetical protein [Bradyrhizobium sp. G127]MCF2523913.1 hypothetical protein [Bradyrhizobium sp. G127]